MKAEEKAAKANTAAAASSSGAASTAAPKAKSKARAKSQAPSRARTVDDDNVEISGITINDSQDINFWKVQSANEIRAQFKLRDSKKYYDEFAFKTKVQLLDIIKELIKSKQW